MTGRRPGAAVRLAALLLALGVWTWKLLEPHPIPPEIRPALSYTTYAVLSKGLHATVYAGLTVLAATLARTRRGQWAVVGLVVLHGAATEAAQYLMDLGRTGLASDVVIDWLGVAVGVLVLRKWAPPGGPAG